MKFPSILFIGALISSQFIAPAEKALACSCMPQDAASAFQEGNLMITGTPRSKNDVGDFQLSFQFDVEHTWYGPSVNDVTVYTWQHSATCGAYFDLHETYTLLLRKTNDRWTASLCDQSFRSVDGEYVSVAELVTSSFPDVPKISVNATAIAWAKETGIVQGYADGTFKPNKSVNRAEFIKILMEAYNVETVATCKIATFSDVSLNDWYRPYIQAARCKGIISGYADGTFRPADSINFAEAAKIIAELNAGTSISQGSDVWYAPYVMYMNEHGATLTEISPSNIVTREMMVQMMYRLMVDRE